MLGTGNLTEVYAAPFAILSVYAIIRLAENSRPLLLWPLISGLALGTSTMLRPPSALIAAVTLILMPARRRAGVSFWKAISIWVGGCAAIPVATAIWAASKGILRPMLRYCILHNIAYVTGTGVPGSANWRHVGRSLQNMAVQTWLWHLAGLVGLFIAVLTMGQTKTDSSGRRLDLRFAAILWLAAAFASALPSLQFYVHYYYLTLAPLALLSAWAWQELTVRLWQAPWQQRSGAWTLAIVATLFATLQIHWDYEEARERKTKAGVVTEMEDFLISHGRPSETLAVFGWGIEMDVMARLGWPTNTRHPHAIIYPSLPGGVDRLREWKDEMLRTPPVWLVCNDRQDPVTGNIAPIFGWDGPSRAIAQQVAEEFNGRFVEVARLPNRYRKTPTEPAYYVIYRDGTAPQLR
jgi:hypothetical protein